MLTVDTVPKQTSSGSSPLHANLVAVKRRSFSLACHSQPLINILVMFLPCDRHCPRLESETKICNDGLYSDFLDSPHMFIYTTGLPSLTFVIRSAHVSQWTDNTQTTPSMIRADHGLTTLPRQPLLCLRCTALCQNGHRLPRLRLHVAPQ
jgi:hypothetical protein